MEERQFEHLVKEAIDGVVTNEVARSADHYRVFPAVEHVSGTPPFLGEFQHLPLPSRNANRVNRAVVLAEGAAQNKLVRIFVFSPAESQNGG